MTIESGSRKNVQLSINSLMATGDRCWMWIIITLKIVHSVVSVLQLDDELVWLE